MFFNILILSFFLFNHPMTMLFTIITTTLVISFTILKFLKYMWLSLLLILLILGGMLILFLYMISLIPNKKMILKKKMFWLLSISLLIRFNFSNYFSLTMNKMFVLFLNPSMSWLLFMMMYLLLTLIVVMMIIISSKAPMKLYS
uniref:NADH dehydrogenase subunit 6 n=1 Tax=Ixodes anatis TaxID=1965274 RepID=UPI00286BAB38|nr:NADH dehydrogenase subunit 6 [Ixodes anatis]WKW95235.1 NADH dehydrogenase subunit 6 [Ixodes anatis]